MNALLQTLELQLNGGLDVVCHEFEGRKRSMGYKSKGMSWGASRATIIAMMTMVIMGFFWLKLATLSVKLRLARLTFEKMLSDLLGIGAGLSASNGSG